MQTDNSTDFLTYLNNPITSSENYSTLFHGFTSFMEIQVHSGCFVFFFNYTFFVKVNFYFSNIFTILLGNMFRVLNIICAMLQTTNSLNVFFSCINNCEYWGDFTIICIITTVKLINYFML